MRLTLIAAVLVTATSVASARETGSFAASKALIQRRLTAIQEMVGYASLWTSGRLAHTRAMVARPFSDWGLGGVGDLFLEKQSALTNLRFAAAHVKTATAELATARTQVGRWSLRDQLWLRSAAAQLGKLGPKITTARADLRLTRPIWAEQGSVTFGAAPEDRRVLQAFIEDDPADREIIEGQLDRYIEGKYPRR